MNILDQAREDIRQITGNSNDFAVPVIFTSPSADTITVNALCTRHHLSFDTEGRPVNVRNARVSVCEKELSSRNYPYKNQSGEVNMKGHKVTWNDSNGNAWTYVIREWFPDQTLGLLVCTLGDYQQ